MNAIAIITPAQEGAPAFADWLERGRVLLAQRSAAEFGLGEWIKEGKEQFGHQFKFDLLGEKLGIAPQRLKVIAKTVEVFPIHLRDPNLPFDHHANVANLASLSMPDALDVLKTAREQHWDDKETRVAAVRRRAEIAPGLLPEEDWEQVELLALTRAYNRARPSVREDFLAMAEEANGGTIDA